MMEKLLQKVLLGLLIAVAHLPWKALYLLSDLIYVIVYHVIGYRIKSVRKNLRMSFPEKTGEELKQIEKEFYLHLSDLIVETIKLLHISDEDIDRHVEVTGGDLVEKAAEDGRSFILLMAHYGNWEWAQAVSRHYKRPAISGEIYRPGSDAVTAPIIDKIRARFNTLLISQKQTYRTLLKMKMEGKQFIIGFITDQRPNSGALTHWMKFLNQDTAVMIGADQIGNKINAHRFYLDIEKVKRGYYRMTFNPMILTDEEKKASSFPYTEKFMHLLERSIQRQPAYWLWSHNRWKIPSYQRIEK